jgi:DNA-binding MurR/RpiR family transcriptional regulator
MDPTLKTRTISEIKEISAALTPGLRTVALYILNNAADFGLDPIRETARKAGVSTFTLVRMAKRLGFDSYDALRDPFRHALVSAGLPAQSPDWIGALRDHSAVGAVQADAAANALGIVQRSLQRQTSDRMARVTDLMLGARNTYVTGFRSSFALAYYFDYVGRMALPSLQLIPRHMNNAIDELNDADENDVLFAIAFTPCSMETIEACKFAHSRGVRLVILSDSEMISPDFLPYETLIVSAVSTHHFACHAGAMAVIETLLALLVQAGGAQARARITRYEDVRRAQNAYWEGTKKH